MPRKPRTRANEVDVRVGQIIRTLRLSLDMSQTDLGRKIGVTFQQIQKYEKGANRCAAGRLSEIARVLNVDPACFFGELSEAGGGFAQTILTRLQSPHAVRLLQAFDLLQDDDKAAVVRVVVAMTNALPAKAAAT